MPAVASAAWAQYVSAPELLVFSLGLLLLGSACLVAGASGVSAMLVPALFILLIVPIPPPLLNEIMYPLQLFTARAAALVLSAVGLPAVSIGDQILGSGRVFQVIEACSGLRSILMLVMAAVLYAELFSRSRTQWILLIGVAPLIGIVVNVARVMSLVVNEHSRFAAVHTAQGMAMLAGGVAALAGVDAVYNRVRRSPPRVPYPPLVDHGANREGWRSVPRSRIAMVAGVPALLCALLLVVPTWQPGPSSDPTIHQLPRRLGAWQAEPLVPDVEFLGSVRFAQQIYRRYAISQSGKVDFADSNVIAESVDVFVGVDDRLRAKSLVSEKTAVLQPGWEIFERGPAEVPPDGRPVELLDLRASNGRRLAYHWYDGTGSLWVETLRSLLVLDRGPMRREGRAMVIALSTPLSGRSDTSVARERLDAFAPVLRTTLANLGEEGYVSPRLRSQRRALAPKPEAPAR